MKNLTIALFLILLCTGLVPAQLPPAFVSEVNPLETQDFFALFTGLELKGNMLRLLPSSKDSSFKVQIGNNPATTLSSSGIDLPLGTETHIFDNKIYIKFLPFPSSETDKYLFLVEASNAQGLTRVGLIPTHTPDSEKRKGTSVIMEVPIIIDCAKCLKEMEGRVADGTYEYEG